MHKDIIEIKFKLINKEYLTLHELKMQRSKDFEIKYKEFRKNLNDFYELLVKDGQLKYAEIAYSLLESARELKEY